MCRIINLQQLTSPIFYIDEKVRNFKKIVQIFSGVDQDQSLPKDKKYNDKMK